MPVTLRILSLYHDRRKKYAPELARAHAKLEQYDEALVTRFGTETGDAIRQQIRWTADMIFGRVEVPELSDEGEHAVRTLKTLTRKVGTVLKKLHAPDCWFHESPTPISVLETVGLTWDMVQERCAANGRLPVADVLWLLKVLRATEPAMPTDEQVGNWAASGCEPCHLPDEWRRVLWRRRRRLVRLLGRAVELEREVRCRFS
jgi:hypothetical protein